MTHTDIFETVGPEPCLLTTHSTYNFVTIDIPEYFFIL